MLKRLNHLFFPASWNFPTIGSFYDFSQISDIGFIQPSDSSVIAQSFDLPSICPVGNGSNLYLILDRRITYVNSLPFQVGELGPVNKPVRCNRGQIVPMNEQPTTFQFGGSHLSIGNQLLQGLPGDFVSFQRVPDASRTEVLACLVWAE